MHTSFPPGLVDIANKRIIAVIAWKLNIHYKFGDTKELLLMALGHISYKLPLALES